MHPLPGNVLLVHISLFIVLCVQCLYVCTYVCLSVDESVRIHTTTVEMDNVKIKLDIW